MQKEILIIDDLNENLNILVSILSDDYIVRPTKKNQSAIKSIKYKKPDLILLDILLDNSDGFKLYEQIKDYIKDIPVIFISALNSIEEKIKAFDMGAVDYITKPFNLEEVKLRVNTHLELSSAKKNINELLISQDYMIKKLMHEIFTPLSVITLNVDTLRGKTNDFNSLDKIQASVKVLSSVYEDIRYMINHEREEFPKNHIDLLNFLSSRVAYFDSIAKSKDIFLELIADEDISLRFNETELQRLVDNNISNAIKYSNNGSFITIVCKDNNKYISLEFIDEGIGIKEDLIPNIFKDYYKINQSKGLGLGLATVKEICDKYKINIYVKSKYKEGTTFRYEIGKE